MTPLIEYLNNLKNKKIYIIIDDLIRKFNFTISDDSVLNDIRTLNMKTNHFNIKIISKIILNYDTFDKFEFNDIYLNKLHIKHIIKF
jgi:hypothetical protein